MNVSRKVAYLVIAGALASVVSVAIWGAVNMLMLSGRPQVSLASVIAPFETHGQNSSEFLAMNELLRRDLPRKKPWSAEDADLLIELSNPWLNEEPMPDEDYLDLSREEQLASMEKRAIRVSAWSLWTAALRVEHPMVEDVRERLEVELLNLLEHERSFVRIAATSAIVGTPSMIGEAAIRSRIETMLEDSDPVVAANAERQLAHLERLKLVGQRLGRTGGGDEGDCFSCPD